MVVAALNGVFSVVQVAGFEPALSVRKSDPKSDASASCATPAEFQYVFSRRAFRYLLLMGTTDALEYPHLLLVTLPLGIGEWSCGSGRI